MSTVDVARLEVRRLLASPGVRIATFVFAVVVAIGTAIPYLATTEADPATGAAFLLGPGAELVFPVIAVLVTYASVSGHRSGGTIHVLFAIPIDRRGLLVGIAIARVLVLSVIVLVGLAVGIGACLFLYGVPPMGRVLGFVLLTLVAGVSFVVIGVGTSAATGHPRRALAFLIGGLLTAHAVWRPVVTNVLGPSLDPTLRDAVLRLSPLEAYRAAALGILPASSYLSIDVDGEEGAIAEGQRVGGELLAGELLFVLGVLVAWAAIATYVGLRRMRRADIG